MAPLLLSNVMNLDGYGTIEAALAYAAIAAIILNMGITSAIPQYLIAEDKSNQLIYIYWHVGVISLVFVNISGLFLFFEQKIGAVISLLIIFACFQRVMAIEYASLSKPAKSSAFSSYIYVLLLICGIIGYFTKLEITLDWIIGVISVGGLYLIVWLYLRIKNSNQVSLKNLNYSHLKSLYIFSTPNLIFGLLILIFTSMVRIIGVPVFGTEEFAYYAFFFRLASIPIVLYQFLNIVLLKKIYGSGADTIDRIYVFIITCICGAIILSYSFVPWTLTDYLVLLHGYENYKEVDLYFIVSSFMFFWVSIALTELLIYRERIALQVFVIDSTIVIALLLMGGIVTWYSEQKLSLEHLAILHCLIAICVTLYHCRALRKVGIHLIWFFRMVLGLSIICSVVFIMTIVS